MCIRDSGNGVVLSAAKLFEEIAGLEKVGVELRSRLRISEACPLILPFHAALDVAREAAREQGGIEKIGTTGRGIGPAYEDKIARRALRVQDLKFPERFASKLHDLLDLHNHVLTTYLDSRAFDSVSYTHLDVYKRQAWVLPDHIADVLPSDARHIEELRRDLLDTARCYGYERVMPPLLEHIQSLLTGAGVALDLQTFKLVDQLSGRMMGLRADSTPQVARIDAHLLNRSGVTRLCYCGPVLHTRPSAPHATREPLQFGAEIYGHAGLEADIEVLTLALDCLKACLVYTSRCV